MASRRRSVDRTPPPGARLAHLVFQCGWSAPITTHEAWHLDAWPRAAELKEPPRARIDGFIFRPYLTAATFDLPPYLIYEGAAHLPALFRAIYETAADWDELDGRPACLERTVLRRSLLQRAGIGDLFEEEIRVPDQHVHITHIGFRDGSASEENLTLMIDGLVERFQNVDLGYGCLMTAEASALKAIDYRTADGAARAASAMAEAGFVRFKDLLVHRSSDCTVASSRLVRISDAPKITTHHPL